MGASLTIVVVLVCVGFGSWWVTRTKAYRSHRRHRDDLGPGPEGGKGRALGTRRVRSMRGDLFDQGKGGGGQGSI
jgi:hypothetical protein